MVEIQKSTGFIDYVGESGFAISIKGPLGNYIEVEGLFDLKYLNGLQENDFFEVTFYLDGDWAVEMSLVKATEPELTPEQRARLEEEFKRVEELFKGSEL
jgi:hypothetical protein